MWVFLFNILNIITLAHAARLVLERNSSTEVDYCFSLQQEFLPAASRPRWSRHGTNTSTRAAINCLSTKGEGERWDFVVLLADSCPPGNQQFGWAGSNLWSNILWSTAVRHWAAWKIGQKRRWKRRQKDVNSVGNITSWRRSWDWKRRNEAGHWKWRRW